MSDCRTIDPLVTSYVDGELGDTERHLVDAHLLKCPPCHSRVAAERAIRETLCARRRELAAAGAPPALRVACERLRGTVIAPGAWRHSALGTPHSAPGTQHPALGTPHPALGTQHSALSTQHPALGTQHPALGTQHPALGTRDTRATRLLHAIVPLALAASLVVIVGGAFVYQMTERSSMVLAAELTADHVKCFALNALLGTHQTPTAVESAMLRGFGWNVHLPQNAAQMGLELVGARPCLYGEGTIAHVMYRHDGRPVSLFMLPKSVRAEQIVEVLGHEAKIWCAGNRTLVLIAREPRHDVERLAEYVQASLH